MKISFEQKVPDILKPEVPGISTLQKMSKHEPATVLRLSDNGKVITVMDMMLADKWLFDDLKKIHYMVNHDSIKLRLLSADQKATTKNAYIVDDDTASTIELPELIKKMVKPVTIKALSVDGTELKCSFDAEVPANIKSYTGMGSTISLISADQNKRWYSPGPSAWDWFIDNKGIRDMFPSSVNPGWFAVLFVFGFGVGGLCGGLGGVLLGKLLLG